MSNFNRELFGSEALKPTGDFAKKLVEKLFDDPSAPPAVGATAGGLTNGTLLGAATGLAIGLIIHGASSVSKVRKRAKESPLRFLTMLEKEGVAFTMPSED